MKMATFRRFDTATVPSEIGGRLKVNTHVAFTIHGKLRTGAISRQLKNSAITETSETAKNVSLMTQNRGVVIVSYKELKKI